jgi:WD40 repeat protein
LAELALTSQKLLPTDGGVGLSKLMTLQDAQVNIIKCPHCATTQFNQRVDCLRCGSNLAVPAKPVKVIPNLINRTVSPTAPSGPSGLQTYPVASPYSMPTLPIEHLQTEMYTVPLQLPSRKGLSLLWLAGSTSLLLIILMMGLIVLAGSISTPQPVYTNGNGGLVSGDVRKSPNASQIAEISPVSGISGVPTITVPPILPTLSVIPPSIPMAPPNLPEVPGITPTPSENLAQPTLQPSIQPTTGKIIVTPGGKPTVNKFQINEIPKKTLQAHFAPINSVAFDKTGSRLVTGGLDGQIILWQFPELTPLHTFSDSSSNKVFSVAFSPDGKYIAAGSLNGFVRIWDSLTFKQVFNELSHIDGNRDGVQVNSIAFSPDGKNLASGGNDNKINIYDVRSLKKTRTLSGFTNYVETVEFSPQGSYLAGGSNDFSVKIWNLASDGDANPRFNLKEHKGNVYMVAFNPENDNNLASGDLAGQLIFWDLDKKGQSSSNLSIASDNSQIFALAFSIDGRNIISGQSEKDNNKIVIRDINTGKEIQALTIFSGRVRTVTCSPDGKYVVAGTGVINSSGIISIYSIITLSDS